MIGNTIHFKDDNLNNFKGRVLDKVLVKDEDIAITKYLTITQPDSNIILVKPNQINKVF